MTRLLCARVQCYYMGIQTDKGQGSAGGSKKDIAGMFSRGIEPDRICKRTKKKDMQMCELRYPRQVELSKINLDKMRVKDLRRLMDEQGLTCKGCTEKSEFVAKIKEFVAKNPGKKQEL